jgi:hypothetical protein
MRNYRDTERDGRAKRRCQELTGSHLKKSTELSFSKDRIAFSISATKYSIKVLFQKSNNN